MDIDLLATLVQPLRLQGTRVADDGEDEADDSIMAEEAERRELDSKGARATGTEGREASFLLSRETLERARRRLARVALSVEQALSHRKELGPIASAGVIRQIWMTHVGAFLAGRRVSTRLVHTQVRSVTSRTTVPEAAQLWPAAPRPRRCLQG